MKRKIALLMTAVMTVSVVPTNIFAAPTNTEINAQSAQARPNEAVMINPINNAQRHTVGVEGLAHSHTVTGSSRYNLLATAPTLLVPATNSNPLMIGDQFELNLTQGAEWYFTNNLGVTIPNRDNGTTPTPPEQGTSVAVTLTPATITTIGETSQATAVVTVDTIVDTEATVTWTSSNTAIATVDSATGEVTAVANGTADIIGTFGTDVTGQATITVADVDTTPEEGTTVAVTLDPTTIEIGGTSQATEVVTVDGTVDEEATVTWTSSNTAIATVDSATGEVTAVANGTSIITGTFDHNGTPVTGQAEITVEDVDTTPEEGTTVAVTLNPNQIEIGGTSQATEVVTVDGTVDEEATVTWTSSNTAIATVNEATGEVTAVANGTSIITGTFDHNGTPVTGQATITVEDVATPPEEGTTVLVTLPNQGNVVRPATPTGNVTVQATATVTPPATVTPTEVGDITWDIQPAVPGVSVDADGLVTILDTVADDASFTVRADYGDGSGNATGTVRANGWTEPEPEAATARAIPAQPTARAMQTPAQPVARAMQTPAQTNAQTNATFTSGEWNETTRTFTGEGFTLQVSAGNRSNATVTITENINPILGTQNLAIPMVIRTSDSDERPQVQVRNIGSANVVRGTDAPHLTTSMATTTGRTSTTVTNSDRRFTDRLRMGDVVITENSVNEIENGRFEIIAPLGFTFANTNNVTIAGDRGLSEVDFTVATATVTRNPNNSSSVIVDLEDIDLSEVDSQGAIVISGLELVADNDTVPAIAQDVYIKLANMVTTTTSITSTTVANSDRRVTDRLRMGDVVVTENSVNGIERSIFEIIAPSGFTFANVTPKNVTIAGDRGLSEVDFTAAIDIVKRNPNNSPSVIVDLNAMDLSEVDSQGTMVISGLELVADNDTVPAIAQNVYISIANIVPTRPITNQSIRAGVRSNEST
jgi:uncharacterized protein YjdB